MRTYKDTIIIDQPIVDPYLLTNNGYTNIILRWPDDNNKTSTFWPTDVLVTKVLRFSAANYNIKFKVLGSLDVDKTFTETSAIPETTLVVGAPYTIELSKYFTALRIQVAPANLNEFGTFSATLTGTNLPSSTATADAYLQTIAGAIDNGKMICDTEVTATIDMSTLATQTTSAAILAKLIAAPSTEGKQDALIAKWPDQSGGKVPVVDSTMSAKGFYRTVKEFTRPADTTQYAANDCLAAASPSITTQNIPNAGRVVGGTGTIVRAVLKSDNMSWTNPVTLIIYDRAPPSSFVADNAAFDPQYANSDNIVGILEFSELKKDATGAAGSFVRASLNSLNLPYRCADDSTNLYFQSFLPSGTPTPANAQKFKLNLGLVRD